jgi:hypothetical protein
MKPERLLVVAGLLLGLSAVVSASPIHYTDSNYGSVSNTEACYSLGTIIAANVSRGVCIFTGYGLRI